MTFLAWEMSAIVRWFEHSLVLPFLGTGMRIDSLTLGKWLSFIELDEAVVLV